MILAAVINFFRPSIAGAMGQFSKALGQLDAVANRETLRAEDASEKAQEYLAEATAAREHATAARKQREKIASLFADDKVSFGEGIGGVIKTDDTGAITGIA